MSLSKKSFICWLNLYSWPVHYMKRIINFLLVVSLIVVFGANTKAQTEGVQTNSFWPADDNFPGKGPLQKADWFRKLWQQRRGQWQKDVQKDQNAIAFVGDSITQGWNLQEYFPGFKVANRGISGDTTRQLRYRFKEDVISIKPSAIVLLIGTNDLGLGGTPEDAADNISAILSLIKPELPGTPVVVCKVMPRHPEFAEKVKKLNELVDKLVQGEPKFVRCDTYSIFANENGVPSKDEFPDLLHPNAKGYAKWRDALLPIFEKLNLR